MQTKGEILVKYYFKIPSGFYSAKLGIVHTFPAVCWDILQKNIICLLLSFSVSKLTLLNLRNLWVIFNKHVTFHSPILAACSSCLYYMRDLQHIHHHLDLDNSRLPATAIVSSRLDYCSSLLYDITSIDLTRLQRVQKRLARLVTKSPPFTGSLPLLPSCSLRSNNDNSLSVPRVKTNTGARAFHFCAPSLWNNLI